MARRALLLLAVLTLCAAAAPVALADGDPASDYLLGEAAFVPPDAGVPPAYATQLRSVLSDAKARGYTIRVALISSRYDMGSVTALYRSPKLYARFLGQELAFVYKGRVLVVMPNGYGIAQRGKPLAAGQAVLDRLPAPGPSGTALARSATRAVIRLAADAGAIVTVPPLVGSTRAPTSTTNRDRIEIVVAIAVVLLLLGGVGYGRKRLARRPR